MKKILLVLLFVFIPGFIYASNLDNALICESSYKYQCAEWICKKSSVEENKFNVILDYKDYDLLNANKTVYRCAKWWCNKYSYSYSRSWIFNIYSIPWTFLKLPIQKYLYLENEYTPNNEFIEVVSNGVNIIYYYWKCYKYIN